MFLENLVIIFLLFMTLCVIFLNNPIQSLLSLIICFAISSIFFLILGLEFISIVLFIIYIGAIAVLFLFIIMMLNIKIIELSSSYLRYLPIGSFIILFFFLEMCFFFFVEFNNNFYYDFLDFDWFLLYDSFDNIFIISFLIYYYYSLLFFLLAFILLISMFGSIILVLNWNKIKNYNVYKDIYIFKKNIIFFS